MHTETQHNVITLSGKRNVDVKRKTRQSARIEPAKSENLICFKSSNSIDEFTLMQH